MTVNPLRPHNALIVAALLSIFTLNIPALTHPSETSGIKVRFDKYNGPAKLTIESPQQNQLTIKIARNGDTDTLTLFVELPASGPGTWPAVDVQVFDSTGNPVSVRRSGIEWHKLWINATESNSLFFVTAIKPAGDRPGILPEKDRFVIDSVSGLNAKISNWPDGRNAALSIRFDDSHPTHLSKAIPILREYGFRGTFLVNPGGKKSPPGNSRWRSAFKEHFAEWQAVAQRGDQEFGNHTAHHSGAENDDQMESEIRDAAEVIWELFPQKSKLLALNLGGGTYWKTSRTLRYYLDKYHQFDASTGSMGMDDVYGNRVEVFRQHVKRHLQRGLWCRIHYHYIGEELSTSEAHFRAALDVAKEYQDKLWIAGMADIFKYQTERKAAALSVEKSIPNELSIKLTCSTDPQLFDQPLTIEVMQPQTQNGATLVVKAANGQKMTTRTRQQNGETQILFDVPAKDSIYTLEKVSAKND